MPAFLCLTNSGMLRCRLAKVRDELQGVATVGMVTADSTAPNANGAHLKQTFGVTVFPTVLGFVGGDKKRPVKYDAGAPNSYSGEAQGTAFLLCFHCLSS
eukprot:SAG22_NODE_3394_length_1735_cov_1.137531_1_plen_100_part_00